MNNEQEFNDVFNGITERIKLTTLAICADEDSSVQTVGADSNGTSFGTDLSTSLSDFLSGDLFDIS